MLRARWIVGLVMWCIWLMLASGGSAFVLTGPDWSYQAAPMGENWIVCGAGVPGSGIQRTKDGAAGWNYENFTFTFGTDACLSGGIYPSLNNVNQFDFGAGLGVGVLAETTSWYFTNNPADTVECDMRFSSTVPWYTGTGTPPGTQYDWWSVAIHEMGHCLGLDHESRITNPKPVMYPLLAAGEVQRTLTPDDSAGRDAIYGPTVWVPVPGNGFTPSAPAATVFQGNLTLFVQGGDDRIYVNWLFPNNQWTGWAAVPGGGSTPSAPAATVFQDNLALFVQGMDDRIYVNWLFPNDQWTGWAGPVPGGGSTPSAPAATVFQDNLALFVQGGDDRIYVNWLLPNNQWTGWAAVPGGGSTPSAPAATVFQDNLALFVQGGDDRIYVNWLLPNNQWTGWAAVPGGGSTPSAPAATVFQDNLALFVQGGDDRIYVNWLLPNNQWTGWAAVPGNGFTPSAPAATVFQGDLALFVQGGDDRIYVNFTLTGP